MPQPNSASDGVNCTVCSTGCAMEGVVELNRCHTRLGVQNVIEMSRLKINEISGYFYHDSYSSAARGGR